MKNIILITLAVLSFNSFAMECGPTVMDTEQIEDLLGGVKENGDWWAANEVEVLNSPCRKDYPNLAEQESYLKLLSQNAPTEKESINGFNLEDSPAMISLFRELTTYESYSDNIPEEFKNLDKKYQVASDCKKVDCVLGKIFGDSRAKEMLFMKQKFGLNTSPLVRQGMTNFSEAEFKNIQKAIMDLPPHLLPIDEDRTCTRLPSVYSLGLGTLANATITFADEWNKYPTAIQQSTVLHELSHNIGSNRKLDDSNEWLELSGWVKKEKKWESSKDNFVSNYAATNPAEDFAETIVSFRYSPSKLQKTSPEKYKFIKDKVFGGVEYLSSNMCLDSNLFISKALTKAAPALSAFTVGSMDQEMKDKLISHCHLDSVNFLLNRNYKPFEECIEGAIGLEIAKKQLIKDNPKMSVKEIEDNIISKVKGRSARDAFGIKFSEKQKAEISNFSQELMDEYELDAYRESKVFMEHPNKEEYCKAFVGIYPPSNFSKMSTSMNDVMTLHSNEKLLTDSIMKKCLRVQSSFPKYRPFKDDDLKLLLR